MTRSTSPQLHTRPGWKGHPLIGTQHLVAYVLVSSTDSSAALVTITSSFVPSVKISGPSYRTQLRTAALSVFAQASHAAEMNERARARDTIAPH